MLASVQATTRKKKTVPRPQDLIIVPVCRRHNVPTTSLCCQKLINGNMCGAAFCPSCLFERSHGIASNPQVQKVSTLLCHGHYIRFIQWDEERQKEVTIKYKSVLNIFQATSKRTEEIVEMKKPSSSYKTNPERVARYESGSIPPVKPSARNDVTSMGGMGNEYDSITTACSFNFLEMVKDASDVKNMIPLQLPESITKGKKPRVGATNSCFCKYYLGLCVWKHMNMGTCWVKGNSLDPHKNSNNLLEFSKYIEYVSRNHKEVWALANTDGAYAIDATRLSSFCLKVKQQYTRGGTWNLQSDNMDGLWEPFHKLLCKINFPFNAR